MSSAQRNGDELTDISQTSEFVEGRRADTTPFERELWDVLDEIPDPHIPVSLVEMAMIYDVTENDGHVTVEMSFPCMGCPAYDMIHNDVRSCLTVVDGVDEVDIDVVWDPVWSKDMLTESVRKKIREAGISL
ncbi:metal-sulfur cluster assembly factor [Natronococcus occultus]|uniref:Putative metal-sulfur cluster biosynthetic enzyme n=1 Tax=Natronococcus occultus SP4 TaxID=694430 RepID=U3GL12_9EURY|nr:metal-sulfur cluster assembly factor [Natronococcus occultus]AGB36594.1 putative metal-sulfur cluster biosynthetic enzyme [Natronococcus occultus SP4]